MAFKSIQVPVNNELICGWSQTRMVLFLAVAALMVGGMTYRIASEKLKHIVETPIKLGKPLSGIAMQIMDWSGEDVPIPLNVLKVAGADDSLSRLYVNKVNLSWVNLYIAYTARPRNMLGHRPEVCYPASGWVHDYTDHTEVVTKSGRHIPCLLHLFHKPQKQHEERIVLNYYVVNGLLTDDESVFTGVGWRTPNIAGNSARYVAQVQISSVLESSVRQAAQEMSDLLIGFFPGESSQAKTTGFLSGSKAERVKNQDKQAF